MRLLSGPAGADAPGMCAADRSRDREAVTAPKLCDPERASASMNAGMAASLISV